MISGGQIYCRNKEWLNLIHGDSLDEMRKLPDASIDLILTDPPYGITSAKWDIVIPINEMWVELKRIAKPETAICIFGKEPFSSLLRVENIKQFKYDWIWQKNVPTNFLNAKKQPLRNTEIISVFYKKQANYSPQMRDSTYHITSKYTPCVSTLYGTKPSRPEREAPTNKRYPTEILRFDGLNSSSQDRIHPTQKPWELMSYLIKTYTAEGATVLDFCMGSGSTGIACIKNKRKFIGIEKDDLYFEGARDRLHRGNENHERVFKGRTPNPSGKSFVPQLELPLVFV